MQAASLWSKDVLIQRLTIDEVILKRQRPIRLVGNGQKSTAAGRIRPLDSLIERRDRLRVLVARRAATEFVGRSTAAIVDRMILPMAVAAHQDDVREPVVPEPIEKGLA